MGELIFLFIIIKFIVSAVKKSNEEQQKRNRQGNVNYQMPRQNVRTIPAREQMRRQNTQFAQAAKENIQKAKLRAQEKLHQLEMELELEEAPAKRPEVQRSTTPYWEKNTTSSEVKKDVRDKSAMKQIHEGRMEARNTSILERAQKNTDADKEDVTLNTMEAEHRHSERVSAAVHHHPEDVIPESMLGSVEDLMVKGYDGNLCFERDFVGEALDMISRFTVPSEVPEFEKSDGVA